MSYPDSAHRVRATNGIRPPNLFSLWAYWIPTLGSFSGDRAPIRSPGAVRNLSKEFRE